MQAFVAYPNRNSSSFKAPDMYNLPDIQTLIRGTLRFQGFPAFIKTLVELGFLNQSPVEYLAAGTKGLTWNSVTAKALGATDSSEK